MDMLQLATKVLEQSYAEFRLLCWKIDGQFRKSATVSTQQGIFTVLLAAEESIGRSLYCHGQYELDFMRETLAFLRSIQKCPPRGEGTVVDIGANNGVISIGMLHTGELAQAIAIEPEPRNFSLLQRNVSQNGLEDRMMCLPYAVSHQKGQLRFELSETNFGDHRVRAASHEADSTELYHESERRLITVQSDQLDNLLADLPKTFTQNIALMWVDVQGHEGYVFMGAKNLLSKGTPVVAEIWPYGIRQAGMTRQQYCDIAASLWASYWVLRRGKFVRYPLQTLDIFLILPFSLV